MSDQRHSTAKTVREAVTQPGYVFIVGLPRTGTTLTRNILSHSGDIATCWGESHFFGSPRFFGILTREGFRKKLLKIGDVLTDVGAKKIVDYIYDRQDRFWGPISRNVPRDEFLRRLLASDRGDQSLLELAMLFSSNANGEPLLCEKTPAHIYFVPKLLEWFPNAKIIHTFRDPRAIYVSNKKKVEKRQLPLYSSISRKSGLIFELYASLDIIVSWLRIIRLHNEFLRLYPGRYYLSRFEDLIGDPRTHLQKLCEFLGIEFTSAMLQQTVINSSFLPRGHVQGFDTSTIERWRRNLNPVIQEWFAFWCKKQLLAFGYQP